MQHSELDGPPRQPRPPRLNDRRPPPRSPARPRRRLLPIVIIGAAALLVLVAGALLAWAFLAPSSLETLARERLDRLSERYGTRITFSQLVLRDGNHVEIHNLRVDRRAELAALSDEPLLIAPRVDVEVDVWESIWGKTRISALTLEQPRFVIVRAESGASDLDPLVEAFARRVDAKDKDNAQRNDLLSGGVPDVTIQGGSVHIIDHFSPAHPGTPPVGPLGSIMHMGTSPIDGFEALEVKIVWSQRSFHIAGRPRAAAGEGILVWPEQLTLDLQHSEEEERRGWAMDLSVAPRGGLRGLPLPLIEDCAATGSALRVEQAGRIVVTGLEVQGGDSCPVTLRAEQASLDLDVSKGLDGLRITKATLQRPRADLRLDEPPIAFIERLRGGVEGTGDAPGEPSLAVAFIPPPLKQLPGQIVIEDGEVNVRVREGLPAMLQAIDVDVRVEQEQGVDRFSGRFGFGIENGGRFDAEGVGRADGDSADVTMTFARFDIGRAVGLLGVERLELIRGGTLDGRLRVELLAHNDGWRVESALKGIDLNLQHDRLARDPVEALNVGFEGKVAWNPEAGDLTVSGGRLSLADIATVNLEGGLLGIGQADPKAPIDIKRIKLRAAMKATSAQDIFDAIPVALRSEVRDMRFQGRVGFRFDADIDTRDVSDMDTHADTTLDGFRITQYDPKTDVRKLREAFTHSVTQPETGYAFSITADPARDGRWVPLGRISPFVVKAVLTNEDASFYKHKGFSWFQVKASIEDNLEAGHFRRGASTLSMQLVKNVFLSSEKTVARKLQEALLTFAMETVEAIPKDRLMEIYMNIIEWGPGVYGIRSAAHHYFGVSPADLSLAEAVYLITIIPGPRKYHSHYARGSISDAWWERMQRLIKTMLDRGHITQEEYDAAIQKRPEFWKREGFRPPPDEQRKPAVVPLDELFPE